MAYDVYLHTNVDDVAAEELFTGYGSQAEAEVDADHLVETGEYARAIVRHEQSVNVLYDTLLAGITFGGPLPTIVPPGPRHRRSPLAERLCAI